LLNVRVDVKLCNETPSVIKAQSGGAKGGV